MSTPPEVLEIAIQPPPTLELQRDQRAAFRRLADEHLDAAYRLARAILRDPIEAQDATHDAFVRAWRSWHTLRDAERFEAWFDRILVNTCRNRARRAQRFQSVALPETFPGASDDAITATDDRDLIGAAMAALGPDHRVVIALRYYRDLPVEEIALRLGIPIGTVQSRLHYALKRLQAAIAAGGVTGATR